MKKLLVLLTLIVLLLPTGIQAASSLRRDANGNAVHEFSPQGNMTENLTTPGVVTKDMRTYVKGSIYSSTACKVRFMLNSSAALKATHTQSVVPAGAYYTRGVNAVTPFWNISGCTGNMEKQ